MIAKQQRRAQQGAPSQPYPNRTDLARADRQQPIRVPKGAPYGAGVRMHELQSAVPLPGPGEASVRVGAASPAPAPPTPEDAAQSFRFPEELGIAAPTRRPNEPITAGLPIGPGPGPEVLGGANSGMFITSTLSRLAQATGDTAMMRLADIARAQGV